MLMQNTFAPLMAQAADPVSPAAALGGVMIFLGVAFLLAVVFSAIFIHLAAKLLGFSQTFGTAMFAVLWQMLFGVVLFVVLAMSTAIVPALAAFAPFTQWLGATLGIRQAYNTTFFRALAAAFLSGILTVVAVVVMLVVLALAAGLSMKQIQDEINKRKEPTTSVEANIRRSDGGSGEGALKRSTPARCLSLQA